jgi:NAD+ diphosphatase
MSMISRSLVSVLEKRFVFSGNTLLVQKDGTELPDEGTVRKCLDYQLALDWFSEPELGYTALILETDAPQPAGFRWMPLREYFTVPGAFSNLAARARSLLNWRRSTRFCGSCGGALHDSAEETARKCILCGRVIFPAIEPAIIVLISKNDSVLLARHAYRNTNVYTCIAGFVEQGESIEEAVHREVLEETGVLVQNVRYVASQSWPFPNQLMLAFRADWKSGEIRADKKEISDLKWFPRDKLPDIPPPGSVAWRLIMGEI